MKITFKRKDNDYPGYKEYIKPVVDQAFFSDTFIEILCEILMFLMNIRMIFAIKF